MKKFTALLSGLLLASGLAFADDKSSKPDFSELDANRDGAVSKQELRGKQDLVAHFADADTDRDGRLTQSEFRMLRKEVEEAE